MMRYSVDRIEEDFAVLIDSEGGETVAALALFERLPCEGELVALCDGRFAILPVAETEGARRAAQEQLRRLLE